MKATINGIHVELSVDEFKQLTTTQNNDKTAKTEPEDTKTASKENKPKDDTPKPQAKHRARRKSISKDIVKRTYDAYASGKSLQDAMVEVHGKCSGGLARRVRDYAGAEDLPYPAHRIKRTSTKKRERKKKTNDVSDKTTQQRRRVFSRAQNICKYENRTMEKALKMAWMEERAREAKYAKDRTKPMDVLGHKVELFEKVKPHLRKVALDMLRRIADNGGVLQYRPDAKFLGIENMQDWHTFCLSVALGTSDVCYMLGLNGKFLLDLNTLTLRYQKKGGAQ